MTALNRQQLQELAEYRADHCVSVYLPTYRNGPDQQQNPVRLRNLVDRARDELSGRGVRRPDAELLLEPISALYMDGLFWRASREGLACFSGPGFFRWYQVPRALEEQVCVCGRFRIQPLLPLLYGDERFFVLTLDQDDARLYEATRESMTQVELPPIPRVLVDGEDQTLQSHTQHDRGATGDNSRAMFHGHGGPADRAKEDIAHFFSRVDAVVARELADEQAPLILACVDYLAPIYRATNSYRYLVETNISGSPNRVPLRDIHQRAWGTMEARLNTEVERSFDRLRNEVGVGRGSTNLRDVVLAADDGRVETLFVSRRAHLWGRVDGQSRLVEVSDNEHGDELLDFAAARTLSCRGAVHTVDHIPEVNSPVAAIFRY